MVAPDARFRQIPRTGLNLRVWTSVKLGPYEILAPIDAGGMGKVGQAPNTGLGARYPRQGPSLPYLLLTET